jgi:hypothetical protein
LAIWQQIELVKEPTIPTAINPDQTNVAPSKLNDLVESEMEISAAIPTSPTLFRVDSHASFGHVQRESRVLTVGSSEKKVVHDFPCRNTRGNNSAKPARLRGALFGLSLRPLA